MTAGIGCRPGALIVMTVAVASGCVGSPAPAATAPGTPNSPPSVVTPNPPPLAATSSLATPGSSTPPDATGSLSGCVATMSAGEGWKYDCEDIYAVVQDADGHAAPQELLEGFSYGLRSSLPGSGAPVAETIEVNRHRSQGVRITSSDTWRNGKRATGAGVAIPRPEGTRLVSCVAVLTDSAQRRCRLAMDQLAASAWRGPPATGTTAREVPLQIAGRAVDVSPGCEGFATEGGGKVKCSELPYFTWALCNGDAQCHAIFDRWVDTGRKDNKPIKEEPVPCQLVGIHAQCRRLTVDGGAFYFATANMDGQGVVAMCVAPDENSPAPNYLPPGCSPTLHLLAK
jgi:hypothetical protein